jgi:hypothetical protein
MSTGLSLGRIPAGPTRRFGGVTLRSLASVGVVVSLLVLVTLVASASPAAVAPAPASPVASTLGTASTSLECNPVHNPAPSSLYIDLNEPKKNLTGGGQISMTMEFAVVNYSSSDLGTSIHFPTLDFSFPLVPSGTYTLTISPQTLQITGAGWTTGTDTNRSATPVGGLHFSVGAKARISTQKVAIQADLPYGQLTMEFRWMWSDDQPNGTVAASPWSVPTSAWTGGSVLPSIFFPAQYIQFISGPGNGQSVTIGTNYSAVLGGPVAGRYFFLEMENGSGSVVNSHGTTVPANAVNATVNISILNYDHYLAPGSYLVHIHDVCGAILYNKLVKAVFAPEVNITFFLQPSSCGPMTFNGTSFVNNTTGTFVPSTTPYLFTVPHCTGYSFKNWTDTGGLHISSSDHLMVSYAGTLTIEFKPST